MTLFYNKLLGGTGQERLEFFQSRSQVAIHVAFTPLTPQLAVPHDSPLNTQR